MLSTANLLTENGYNANNTLRGNGGLELQYSPFDFITSFSKWIVNFSMTGNSFANPNCLSLIYDFTCSLFLDSVVY